MNLQKASNALYDIIALDRRLRDEILMRLVETDESICFLLSLHSYFSHTNIDAASMLGKTTNYAYQLREVLLDIRALKTLGLKEQVVLREILREKSKVFSYTVFFGYGVKVFSKAEILKELDIDKVSAKLPYVTVKQPKAGSNTFYSKTVINGRVKYNNIPQSYPKFSVNNNETILVDTTKSIVAVADSALGEYLRGKSGVHGELISGFKFKDSFAEIQQEINGKVGEYVAIVLAKDGVIELNKELREATYPILDLVVNGDFELIGVWIVHNDKPYKVLGKRIPEYINVARYNVTIKYHETLGGKLTQTSIKEFKLKGDT